MSAISSQGISNCRPATLSLANANPTLDETENQNGIPKEIRDKRRAQSRIVSCWKERRRQGKGERNASRRQTEGIAKQELAIHSRAVKKHTRARFGVSSICAVRWFYEHADDLVHVACRGELEEEESSTLQLAKRGSGLTRNDNVTV